MSLKRRGKKPPLQNSLGSVLRITFDFLPFECNMPGCVDSGIYPCLMVSEILLLLILEILTSYYFKYFFSFLCSPSGIPIYLCSPSVPSLVLGHRLFAQKALQPFQWKASNV